MISQETQRENQIANSKRHISWYNEVHNVHNLHKAQCNWGLKKAYEYIEKSHIVGEFGCLDGSVGYYLWKLCRDYFAYDLPQVIEQVMFKRMCPVTYVGVDLDRIFPIPVFKPYDLILALDVIEHLYNDEDFLGNCHTHLSNHGKIIVSTPIAKAPGTVNQEPSRQTHFREYGVSEFYNMFNKYFIVLETHADDEMMYVVGGRY
jgi:SAM-dependent methyltransferase